MFLKMLSLLVLVLMSASIDCQSNDSICDFLSKDGRVRDIGIYQYLYQFTEYKIREENKLRTNKSIRLFQRGTSSEEYAIVIKNRTASADPYTHYNPYGLHKFFVGQLKLEFDTFINCRVERGVCLCDEWLFYANVV